VTLVITFDTTVRKTVRRQHEMSVRAQIACPTVIDRPVAPLDPKVAGSTPAGRTATSHTGFVLGARSSKRAFAESYFPSETATADKRPNDLFDRDLEARDDAGVAASRE
jgi:hypothetical protein